MELWPFRPEKKITEVLSWKTDIIRCIEAEQRFSQRDLPRLNWQYRYLLDAEEYGRARLISRSIGNEELLAPRWIDMAVIGAVGSGTGAVAAYVEGTSLAAGMQAVIWQSSSFYEVVTVSSVGSGGVSFSPALTKSYGLAYIIPLETLRLRNGMKGTRTVGAVVRAAASMLVDYVDAPGVAISYPSYKSHPVLIDKDLVLRAINESVMRESSQTDSGVGNVVDHDMYAYPVESATARWEMRGRAKVQMVRQWLHTVRGSWKGFWTASWNNDLVLVADISSADTAIVIQHIGYTNLSSARELLILTTSDAYVHLQVSSATVNMAGDEELQLVGSAGVDLTIAEVKKVMFLNFMRMGNDQATFQHDGLNTVLTMPVVECPLP